MNLMELLKELPAIAERADRERLSCLWPEFEKAHPALAEEIKYCASIEDSQTVLKYLNDRVPIVNLLRFTTPKLDDTILFIHQFLREKLHDQAKHPKFVGSGSTADALRNDRRSNDPAHGHHSRRNSKRRIDDRKPGQRN